MDFGMVIVASIGFCTLSASSMGQSKIKAEPFALSAVHLRPGPFADANKICVNYLETVDPDRLLHSFRKNSGLEPKGKIYGGWEDSGLAGHSLGHFLTACSQEYASTKNLKLKSKVDYIVAELTACQKNRPDGYIAAMPDGDRVWAEVKKGDIRSHGFDLNGLWSPWYTHHKVLIGLIDAYKLTGNKEALVVATKFADWMIEETKPLTPEQWEKMLGCEYGGMNDALAELYTLTSKTQYLDLAKKFYDHRVLDPLTKGQDDLPGKHSNTQIPKIIGLARLYEVAPNNDIDAKAAKFFWETVVHHHTYAIGGNSNHEYLGKPDELSNQLSSNTCETCNTYNMLKLTRHLFEWDPQAAYFDFYERAHLNHILASQDPKTGGVTYFMPLGSGSRRQYSNAFDDFTCCHGSGMENHTKHADSIYFHSGNSRLYVNLFIASDLDFQGQNIEMDTAFPLDGKVGLTIKKGSSKLYEMAIRHPDWVTGPLDVRVNGTVVKTLSKPSSYIVIKRTWKSGDRVDFTLPMSLHSEVMPDNPKRAALMYGPLVLAADLTTKANVRHEDTDIERFPVLVTDDKPISTWLVKDPTKLEFKTQGVARPNDITLLPFYQMHRQRYAVYLDEFSDSEWATTEASYRAEEARRKDLLDRTIDMVRIGEMQPERDHKLTSEKNDVRGSDGKNFRSPMVDGWFQVEMKCDPAVATELVMTYWGNERMRPDFEVLVDGKVVASEMLKGRPMNQFFDVTYTVPKELTAGKSAVTVRVQTKPGKGGASVSGMRLVRAK
jgi:DUF1680 family protein